MNYQVLARKWRPRTFDELVGQQHVARTLANAIDSGRLAHAYVFAGLRGTGKTTVARIFAACLNAEDGPRIDFDPDSDVAREIAESRNMDVMELDAATRTQVDNIRELQEIISYAPVRDRYKVLIIDEAHMLSRNAANALLKTLEEPPPHVIFVLATTEIQKLLPTILSRCQVFEFRRVPPADIGGLLRKIVDAEGVTISDLALDRIARAGEGSVRDSLSLLERVLAFCGTEVEDETVLRVLGAVRTEILERWLGALAARDAGALLGVLDEIVDEGHDLVHFWSELISVLRDLIYLRAAPDRATALSRSEAEAETLAAAAKPLSAEDLTRTFQLIADLEAGLKSSSQPRYLFEACLIRLASLGAVRPIETFLRELSGGAPGDAPADTRKAGPAAPAKRRTAPRPAGSSASRAPAAPQSKAPTTPQKKKAATAPGGESLLRALSREFAEEHGMLASILDSADGYREEDDALILSFPAGSQLLTRQLERKEQADRLTAALERLTGRPLAVRSEIGGGPGPVGPGGDGDGDGADDSPGGSGPAPGGDGGPAAGAGPVPAMPGADAGAASDDPKVLLQRARKEPGVRKLLREFGAQVLEVRPMDPLPVPPAFDEAPPVEDS